MAYGVILGQTPQADIPIGGIILWSGSTSNIPIKWQLCDGTNGTPDLRGQFVIGAGGSYSVGNTGGESEHTLTVDEMPSHNHTFTGKSHNHTLSLSDLTTSSAGAHSHNVSFRRNFGGRIYLDTEGEGGGVGGVGWSDSGGANYYITASADNAGAHTHTISGSGSLGSATTSGTISSVGSGNSHNNMPPYYALCYIMKIA